MTITVRGALPGNHRTKAGRKLDLGKLRFEVRRAYELAQEIFANACVKCGHHARWHTEYGCQALEMSGPRPSHIRKCSCVIGIEETENESSND
jgi:hypothetical protein